MRARGEGTLAFITSIGGKIGVPHLAPYSSAKFAEVGFAQALRAEVAKDGVHVLTVVPGLMRTGSPTHAQFGGDAEKEYAWFTASANAHRRTHAVEGTRVEQTSRKAIVRAASARNRRFADRFGQRRPRARTEPAQRP